MKYLFVLLTVFICFAGCKNMKPDQAELRIISLAPALTEILFSLDENIQVSGITDYCVLPDGKTSLRIGGFNSFNYELMLSLNPDRILAMDSTSREEFSTLKKLFGEDKIISIVHPHNFADIFEMIRLIGTVSGHEENAERIIRGLEEEYEQLKRDLLETGNNASKPSVFVEIYYPPFYTAGKDTFFSEIIALAGGRNPVTTESLWPVLSHEDFYMLNPDIILKLNHNPVDAALKAFDTYKKRHIYTPEDINMYLQPGMNSIQAVKDLKKVLTSFQ